MLFSRTETVNGLVNNDNLNTISINYLLKDKWVKSTSTKRVTASLLLLVSVTIQLSNRKPAWVKYEHSSITKLKTKNHRVGEWKKTLTALENVAFPIQ